MKIADFDRKKTYWDAFWQKEVLDRPIICVSSPKDGVPFHQHMQTDNISAMACLSKNYDPFLESFRKSVATTYYGGEAIPYATLTLGPDQYAGFLGGEIISKEGYDTTWLHKIVDDWTDFEVRLDKSKDSYFDKIKKFMEYAAKFANDEFVVGMLDLHSNMDALSALRGPQDLCFDLMDCPEEVHRVLNDVRKTYAEVFEMAYKAGNMEKTGSLGWAPTYLPSGRFAVIQCDFSCMISPSQAREFVIPAIEEEAAYLDRCVYHYDGKEALGHLDDILAIKDIDVIQWVPGDGQPRTIEWMDLLKKIQKAGKGLWIYDWSCQEIEDHFKELSPEGLVFSTWASSQSAADKLIENVKRKM
jgi:hypothetical protein